MTRSLTAALLAMFLLLTGCGASDEDKADDSSSEPAKMEGNRATVAGISFEVPENWTVVDADTMSEGASAGDEMADIADRMGATPEEVVEMMGSIDLYVVSDKGAAGEFLDNINAIETDESLPNDATIEAQYQQLGATVSHIERSDSEAGETVRSTYEMPIQTGTVNGESLIIDIEGGAVTITVSAGKAADSASIMDVIVDTLANA